MNLFWNSDKKRGLWNIRRGWKAKFHFLHPLLKHKISWKEKKQNDFFVFFSISFKDFSTHSFLFRLLERNFRSFSSETIFFSISEKFLMCWVEKFLPSFLSSPLARPGGCWQQKKSWSEWKCGNYVKRRKV